MARLCSWFVESSVRLIFSKFRSTPHVENSAAARSTRKDYYIFPVAKKYEAVCVNAWVPMHGVQKLSVVNDVQSFQKLHTLTGLATSESHLNASWLRASHLGNSLQVSVPCFIASRSGTTLAVVVQSFFPLEWALVTWVALSEPVTSFLCKILSLALDPHVL